jgi:hypothetical protein
MAEAVGLHKRFTLGLAFWGNWLIVPFDYLELVEMMRDGGFSSTALVAIYDECNIMWHSFDYVCVSIIIGRLIKWLMC